MKSRLSHCVRRAALLVCLIFSPLVGQGAALTLYVAPAGSDQNAGTLERPFLTLPRPATQRASCGSSRPGPSRCFFAAAHITWKPRWRSLRKTRERERAGALCGLPR